MNLRRIPLGLLVVLLAFVAHAPSLRGGFHYDDENVILLNREHLEDGGSAFRALVDPSVFSGIRGNPMFRPVAHASHVLDAHLGSGWGPEGPDRLPFHLTNLLLHLGTAWVLYHLLRRVLGAWFRREPLGPSAPDGASAAAFLGALWFALHPANSEVVNYVSARSESLAALFFLLALLAHHAAWEEGVPRGRRAALVAGSLLAAALSFGSKETGVLLPAAAAALDLWGRPGLSPWRERLRAAALRAAPFALAVVLFLAARKAALGTAAVDLAARASMAGEGKDPMVGGGRSLLAHLLTQARILPAYAWLLLCPVDLAPDYGVRVSAGLDLPTAAALVLLAGGAALVVLATLRGGRALPLAAAWAAAAAAPSILVPLNVLMNDHRLYLPSTGLALLAGLGLLRVLEAARRGGRRTFAVAGTGAMVLFATFISVDRSRAATWRDAQDLWERAVETSPASWRSHLHLGVEYFRKGQKDFEDLDGMEDRGDFGALFVKELAEDRMRAAQEEFEAAHRLYPGAFETRLDLGFLHLYLGQLANRDADPDEPPPLPGEFQEAIRWFTLAEQSSPNSFRALYNRATAMGKAGRVKEAIAEFERLAKDESRTTIYAWALSDLYRRAGRSDDALAQLDLIERLEPTEAGTLALRRGETLAQAGRFAEAEKALRRAKELLGDRDRGPPLFMARMLVATGIPENLPMAAVLWKAALERGHRPGPRDRAVLDALRPK